MAKKNEERMEKKMESPKIANKSLSVEDVEKIKSAINALNMNCFGTKIFED